MPKNIDYVPMIDLDNCPLSLEEICEAILTIPGAKPYGGKGPNVAAFELAHGGMVVVGCICLGSRTQRRLSLTCAPGHPEEFGQVATAIAEGALPY